MPKQKGAIRHLLKLAGTEESGCFLHLAGTQAPCAYTYMAYTTTDDGAHPVQVGQKTPPGCIVRVAHIVPAHWSLTANLATFGHGIPPAKL